MLIVHTKKIDKLIKVGFSPFENGIGGQQR